VVHDRCTDPEARDRGLLLHNQARRSHSALQAVGVVEAEGDAEGRLCSTSSRRTGAPTPPLGLKRSPLPASASSPSTCGESSSRTPTSLRSSEPRSHAAGSQARDRVLGLLHSWTSGNRSLLQVNFKTSSASKKGK
jgi:hypothetical protein